MLDKEKYRTKLTRLIYSRLRDVIKAKDILNGLINSQKKI